MDFGLIILHNLLIKLNGIYRRMMMMEKMMMIWKGKEMMKALMLTILT